MASTAYISHPECQLHDMGAGHPECPERLAAINDALVRTGIMDLLRVEDAEPATREQLLRAHSVEHVDRVFANAPASGSVALDPDTSMNSHSLEAALRAAGAAVQATERVLGGEVKNAFCAVRPPGHHAEYDRAMGFCIFNNIAVAAAHALEVHKLKRVAVVDFDVHHGNGTEDIFARDPRVMLCSSYQHPFYPYSGGATQPGHLVNVPLPAGTTSDAFREAITAQWLPQLNAFAPECIFISAGFDAHKFDPLANMNLTESDFSWITREIMTVADQHCEGRIVSSLEGGYDLEALALSVMAHVRCLARLDAS